MTLLDEANIARVHVPSVVLDSNYALVFKKGSRIMEGQNPRTCFPIKRKAYDTNINLWLDGSIYPIGYFHWDASNVQDTKGIFRMRMSWTSKPFRICQEVGR
jgi:hypothetical protein